MAITQQPQQVDGGVPGGWTTILDEDLTTYANQDLTVLTQDATHDIGNLTLYLNNLTVAGTADMVNGTGLVLVGVDDTGRVALQLSGILPSWDRQIDEIELTYKIETFSLAGDGTFGGYFLQWASNTDYSNTNCGGYIHDTTTSYQYGVNSNGTRFSKGTNPGWTQTEGPWIRFKVGSYGILFFASTTEEGLETGLVGRVARTTSTNPPRDHWNSADPPRFFLYLPVNVSTGSMVVSSIKLRHRDA